MFFFKNKVFFIRHGETKWNLEERTQGSGDSPLTKKGILQAKQAAENLKGHKFDLMSSSPLGRALQTAKIIAVELNIFEIKINSNLAERQFGVLEGKSKEESLKLFPEYWDKQGHFIHNSEIKDGESLDKFLQRIKKSVKELEKLSETKNILVVTHSSALHAIVGHIKNIPFGNVQKSYKFNNCEPIVLE